MKDAKRYNELVWQEGSKELWRRTGTEDTSDVTGTKSGRQCVSLGVNGPNGPSGGCDLFNSTERCVTQI
jgi:hypothetical protein